MNPLILFYIGSHPDSRGRLLAEILEQDDYWLEVTHDYIQWLFPNKDKSRVTPGAPTVTKVVEEAFLNDEILRRHLKASFNRMLAFYGLVDTGNGIEKSDRWERRKANWFVEDTHNNLRITRILKCLSLLGLEGEARKFHEALVRLVDTEEDCGVGELAQRHWAEAIRNV